MAVEAPLCDFGWKAADFRLKGIDGKTYGLAEVRGPTGLVVMFICNHCPYVRSIIDRIVRDIAALQALGVGAIAIMSNDPSQYPEDSFENMQTFARQHQFPFPYVVDATQDVARTYGAVCTPDFFGFDAHLGLQYRGRLDASGKEAAPPDSRRELYEAMRRVAHGEPGPREQVPTMGCSIKWRYAD